MQKGRFALTPEIQLRALAGKELNVRARCVRSRPHTHAQQFEPMIDVSAVWRSEPQERRLFWDQEVRACCSAVLCCPHRWCRLDAGRCSHLDTRAAAHGAVFAHRTKVAHDLVTARI